MKGSRKRKGVEIQINVLSRIEVILLQHRIYSRNMFGRLRLLNIGSVLLTPRRSVRRIGMP